jgi:hypothetical protein
MAPVLHRELAVNRATLASGPSIKTTLLPGRCLLALLCFELCCARTDGPRASADATLALLELELRKGSSVAGSAGLDPRDQRRVLCAMPAFWRPLYRAYEDWRVSPSNSYAPTRTLAMRIMKDLGCIRQPSLVGHVLAFAPVKASAAVANGWRTLKSPHDTTLG